MASTPIFPVAPAQPITGGKAPGMAPTTVLIVLIGFKGV